MSRVAPVSGRFGPYGGRYVPETLMAALEQLTDAYMAAKDDPDFRNEFDYLLKQFAGRPTRLYFARRLTDAWGGARIYLKREDLAHTGSHKINNTVGQGLLAVRMNKKRLIAETGAGQHGVATATAAALLGLECDIFMGTEDIRRQRLNVFRMQALGARVVGVGTGQRTLRTPSTRPCATGWPPSRRPTTVLARRPGRTHSRPSSAISSRSSASRHDSRSRSRKGACPT